LEFDAVGILAGSTYLPLQTSATFLLVSLALITSRPTYGIMKVISSDLPGSRAMRLLLPVIVFITLLFGFLVEEAQNTGFVDPSKGSILLIILLIFVYSPMIYFTSRRINEAEEELNRSVANQAGLIESTDDQIWSVDREYRLITGNGEFLRDMQQVFGRPLAPGESILQESLPLEVRKAWQGYFDRALGGEPFAMELQTILIQPPQFREYHFNPIIGTAGQVLGAAISSRDITERKQAEKSLLEFRQLMDESHDAIYLIDLETGRYIDFNRNAHASLGYSREELLQMTVLDVAQHLPNMEIWNQRVEEIRASDGLIFETIYRHKDGSLFPVEVSARMLEYGGKTIMLGVVRDIRERKQTEESVRKSEQVLREAESLGHTGSWEQNLVTGEMFNTEQNLRLFFGNDHNKEADFEGFAEAVHADDRDYVIQRRVQLLNERGPGDIEFRVVWPDGSVHVIFGRSTVVYDDLGRAIRVYGTNVDITERKQAELQIQQQLARLTALREIDRAIVSTTDVRLSLGILLSQTLALLGIDAADILLLNRILSVLEYSEGTGFRTAQAERRDVRVGDGFAGKAALSRNTVHVRDLSREPLDASFAALVRAEGFVEYVCIPLLAKGRLLGVLETYQRNRVGRDAEWIDTLELLAGQAAIAIDNAQTFEGLERSNMELIMAYDSTIAGWSRAMDLRDKETEGHTQRVTELTIKLAQRLGISNEEQVQMRRGALLHDIGKLGVPDSILLKPGTLTDDEWVIMKRHTEYAHAMLSSIIYLRPAIDIPYSHHEKWDGTGYPRGLQGEQIPLPARIFSVVDVWDALTSDRPYRPAWSRDKTLEYIREGSGKYFDPGVVQAFLQLMDDLSLLK
jgi:PAS domain S-box-containing protein/putative nucleotidyltransferase with HDIG domain